ncbi:MAG: transcription termination/antitermination protein NusG [Rickettsiaceae bacterium]|nr:transcription termination/antitermination protein NusG [Rickettsiaceae bacterium]
MQSKWYIIHAHAGSEKKIRESILEQAQKKDMESYFEEILVPTALVSEIKRGKQVSAEKKILPGYILIKMILNDESWHIIKSTNKVSGFLGNEGKPSPVPEAEIRKIMQKINDNPLLMSAKKIYEEGEKVKVIDGPFESFTGIIEQVDIEKMKLKVSVSIFGRPTAIDLSFNQVERQ